MGQQWSTTVQFSYLKLNKTKNKKVIRDYGSTKIEGAQVFCWGFLVLKTTSTENNNSHYSCYMLHPSLLYNSPLFVYSISVDHSHLWVIVVHWENEYSLILDNRTHAHKRSELQQCFCNKTQKRQNKLFTIVFSLLVSIVQLLDLPCSIGRERLSFSAWLINVPD